MHETEAILRLTDCTVDLARHRLFRDGEASALTTREAELLAYLFAREGQDVERDTLLRDVWGYRSTQQTRAVDFTIRRLRTKVEPDPANPVHIIGVRGVGYRFVGAPDPTTDTAPLPVPAAPSPQAPAPIGNLPTIRASFLGRTAELDRLDALLGANRLVTVLGMGGSGKTALVLHWTHERAGRFPGGAWFCELASARDTGEVLDAVAAGLSTPTDGRTPQDQLTSNLAAVLDARGESLVVLDNAEHVDLAPLVGSWLDRTFDVRFLVTSRERLQLAGEAVLLLDPLDEADGAALFVERARAARGPTAVTDADADAVREIVRGLDGLPLAIEIAASRVATMSPTQLAARLASRFRLITAPAGSRPDRHSSLRAALDWSWELLDGWERRALAVASVFHGGFTLEAVEDVLLLDDPAAPWPLDLLQSLVDKSLVRVDDAAGARTLRYRLLESVRAYAAEHLAALPERDAVRTRHAEYFIREGEALSSAVEGPGGSDLLDRLTVERGNLTAAWLHAPDPVSRVRAGLVLRVVLAHRGPFDGFGPLLDELVRLATASAPDDLRARAHVARARFHDEHRPDLAEADLEAALDAAAAHAADPTNARAAATLRAMALYSLATLRAHRGEYADAAGAYREAMHLHEASGERAAAGRDAIGLAFALSRSGHADEAERTYQRALASFRRSGDRWGVGLALANLSGLLESRGDSESADAQAREAVHILEEVGDRKNCSRVLRQLAHRLAWRGDTSEAEALLRRALAIQQQIGDQRLESVVSTDLAEVLVHRDQLAEAEALLISASGIARASGDRGQEGEVLRVLGLLRLLEELDWEAEPHLEDAVALLRERAHRASLPEALATLALLRVLQRRPDDAVALLTEAEPRATELGQLHIRALIGLILVASATASGDLAAAAAARERLEGELGRQLDALAGAREVMSAWLDGADPEPAPGAHPAVTVLVRAFTRETDDR